MAFKLITLAVLVAVAAAAPQYHSAPGHDQAVPAVYAQNVKAVDADYDSNPEYAFSYEVHDDHTGDIKNQHETRHGDVVEGSYSLIEADGTRRIVEYRADAHSGFNAIVHREGVPQTPVHKYDHMNHAAPAQQAIYNHGPSHGYQQH